MYHKIYPVYVYSSVFFNIVQNCMTSAKPITLKRLLVQVCGPFLFIPQPQEIANLFFCLYKATSFWTFHTGGIRQYMVFGGLPQWLSSK